MDLKFKVNPGILLLLIAIVIFLALPLVQLKIATLSHPIPKGILTLGGSPDREEFTFNFAKTHPDLPIWISSGSPPEYVCNLYTVSGVKNPLTLDYSAVDTVTNFTSLAHKLHSEGVNHVYIVTSGFHMARAQAIATIVLGSQSIAFTPIPSSMGNIHGESNWRKVRDIIRSYVWALLGKTGSSLIRQFRSHKTFSFLPNSSLCE